VKEPGHRSKGIPSPRAPPAAGWCAEAPGTSVPFRCVRAPDHRHPLDRDKGAIAPLHDEAYVSSYADPRSNRDIPGASVTEQDSVIGSRRFESGIPGPVHEPSNWFFGQQAWWTVGTAALIARGLIAGDKFISILIAFRYRGAIIAFRAEIASTAHPTRRTA